MMTHVADNEPVACSRALTGTAGDIFSPAQLKNQRLQKKLGDLTEKEEQLAENYGMISSEGIDSVAVFQEAKERAQSGWKRLPSRLRIAVRLFCRNTNALASNKAAAADMHKLYHLRLKDARIPRPLASVISEPYSFIRGAPHRVDASRFWAVLIGIDEYEGSPLHGCVSDASLIKKFLIDDLGVPKKRIQCLIGSHNLIPDDPLTPSRANIVNTLYSLIHNDEIQLGDNIIIYYAGHGSSYHCSKHSFIGSKCSRDFCPVEALCPIDRDTLDSDGRWIPDISDRELNAIFTQISLAKGYRITFIADCCHAGGISRGPGIEARQRSICSSGRTNVNDMLRAADERLKSFPCYRSVLSKDWKPDMSSHVVLAACRDYQRATEILGTKGYRGVLTKTLVRVLRSDAWKRETTYVELTELLNQSYSQTPVVAGDRKYGRLWYQSE
ncbi:uncharacterized protein ARMOST_20807 [Armillaria ostoyae]|uniref:Peptidase C14 caspase domain-containing protein n=1 Tax=Armillaria ostoyae TaxID=47428 RepID=A0A284S8G2_ARMOS|nr:uncharacterized protein ARMOST_20807 [Armillaria ostoyae]